MKMKNSLDKPERGEHRVGVLELLAELSLLAGEPVDLVQWQSPGGRLLYLIAPVDRAQLRAAFWSSVRTSPSQGAWDTPEQAVAGFAAGAKGWVASQPHAASSEVDARLRARLAFGPVAVAALLSEAAAARVSNDRLSRAARRIGVSRRKLGMGGGWVWALPEECAPASAAT